MTELEPPDWCKGNLEQALSQLQGSAVALASVARDADSQADLTKQIKAELRTLADEALDVKQRVGAVRDRLSVPQAPPEKATSEADAAAKAAPKPPTTKASGPPSG